MLSPCYTSHAIVFANLNCRVLVDFAETICVCCEQISIFQLSDVISIVIEYEFLKSCTDVRYTWAKWLYQAIPSQPIKGAFFCLFRARGCWTRRIFLRNSIIANSWRSRPWVPRVHTEDDAIERRRLSQQQDDYRMKTANTKINAKPNFPLRGMEKCALSRVKDFESWRRKIVTATSARALISLALSAEY